MTRLRDKVTVACSADEAQSRLEAYLRSLCAPDGIARMRLRVPMSRSADGQSLSLDREVRIEAQRARDDENLNDLVRIAWRPEGRTIFPSFEGTLIVWGATESSSSFIELDGSYTPPLSVAGQVFDEVIGHRIAESTARELLKDLKRVIDR